MADLLQLPDRRYSVIYADPPWAYGQGGRGKSSHGIAKQHYDTMTTAEICAMPIRSICAEDGAACFMWATFHNIAEAIKVMEAWGVTYKTAALVWGKKKAKNGKVTKALEIKCLSSEKVVEAFLTNQYPSEYFPQVCKYFIVNDDLEILYFAIYTDLIPELELQIWEIHRNDVRDSLVEMRAYEDAIMARIDEDTQKIIDKGF